MAHDCPKDPNLRGMMDPVEEMTRIYERANSKRKSALELSSISERARYLVKAKTKRERS